MAVPGKLIACSRSGSTKAKNTTQARPAAMKLGHRTAPQCWIRRWRLEVGVFMRVRVEEEGGAYTSPWVAQHPQGMLPASVPA